MIKLLGKENWKFKNQGKIHVQCIWMLPIVSQLWRTKAPSMMKPSSGLNILTNSASLLKWPLISPFFQKYCYNFFKFDGWISCKNAVIDIKMKSFWVWLRYEETTTRRSPPFNHPPRWDNSFPPQCYEKVITIVNFEKQRNIIKYILSHFNEDKIQ